jgi:hypothetical protein
MLPLASPWLILGASFVAVGAIGGSYVKGRSDGKAVIIAKQARDDQIRLETLQLAQLAAAEEIAKISVTHTTIQQKAQVVTREVPVYRDCANDERIVRMLDSARANQPEPVAPGGGELPQSGASPARNFW